VEVFVNSVFVARLRWHVEPPAITAQSAPTRPMMPLGQWQLGKSGSSTWRR
jgi:hypothetical protein